MFEWLAANWINIVLILAIAALVFWLTRGLIRDRKAGKSSCGGNCASCGGCCGGSCGMAGKTERKS